ARVRDALGGGQSDALEPALLEGRDLARGLVDGHAAVLGNGHAGRVIAPVLEALEPLHEERKTLPVAEIGHDAAHAASYAARGRRDAEKDREPKPTEGRSFGTLRLSPIRVLLGTLPPR